MIGPKKLATIRQELEDALAATGNDPIRWLEERMNAPECQGSATSGGSEVLRALHDFLEDAGRRRGRERRIEIRK